MKNKKHYRHGDVVFHETDEISGTIIEHNGRYIVALGEATGHSHTLLSDSMQIKRIDRNQIMLLEDAQIVHQQHKPLMLKQGKYIQVQEREIDHFSGAVRKVVD